MSNLIRHSFVLAFVMLVSSTICAQDDTDIVETLTTDSDSVTHRGFQFSGFQYIRLRYLYFLYFKNPGHKSFKSYSKRLVFYQQSVQYIHKARAIF